MSGIRQARFYDAEVIADIEVETWRATYAGMLADDLLVGMSVRRHARSWAWELRHGGSRVLVWEDDDRRLLGFGQCGRQRDAALPYDGEIYTLYVRPDAQGLGIGRRLLRALFAGLAAQKMGSTLVWVVSANPSRFFYERMGGRLVLLQRTPVGGRLVDTAGYGWSDVRAVLGRCARSGSAGRPPKS